jgi:hypothetical protein
VEQYDLTAEPAELHDVAAEQQTLAADLLKAAIEELYRERAPDEFVLPREGALHRLS